MGTIGPFLWLWKNGGSDSGWGGGGGYDPFSLTGIPVVTDVFTPTQFVSGDTPNTYNGYSVSWKLLTQGGWQTVQLGDAFTLFGASLSGGPSAGPAVPANNGRNCTTGPATKGQYVAATAQVAAMTGEFFSGVGPGNLTFDPNSATSQVMAQSGPVQEVLDEYYMTGKPSGLYAFGGTGYVAAGGNPVAQFVGSFRWSITPGNGGINLSLTNTSSFRSLTYDMGPQWQRGSFPTPMGNTHQTYNITAACQ